jgi:TRAP-type uncharacterized transport system fused permease subunit
MGILLDLPSMVVGTLIGYFKKVPQAIIIFFYTFVRQFNLFKIMIQRVQSLLLLAGSLLLIILLFVPIWKKEGKAINNTQSEQTVSDKVVLKAFNLSYYKNDSPDAQSSKSTWYIGALILVTAGVSLYSIFQYRNRMKQIKLGLLNTLLLCGIIGLMFLGVTKGSEMLPGNLKEDFQLGFYIPAVVLLLNTLSNRFIRKDEELVRSADRIR